MSDFEHMYRTLLHERSTDVHKVGIFPGAFKPPHAGHYYTALNACKNNDEVFIFASSKQRALSTQNKSTSSGNDCDSSRYKNLLQSDSKFTSNLLSIRPAECARMTSASAVRAAIAVKDKETILLNLPEGLGEDEKDQVYNILMQSNDISSSEYGHINKDQMMRIWSIYRELLSREGNTDINNIHINISEGSPVRDTYELVEDINNSDSAREVSIQLYVGT